MNLLDILKSVGEIGYQAQTGGLQISVKTNLGPEIKLSGTSQKGGTAGLAQWLGVKSALIVRDRQGKPIFVHGEIPKTNPLLAAGLLAGVSYLGYLAWRGATRSR